MELRNFLPHKISKKDRIREMKSTETCMKLNFDHGHLKVRVGNSEQNGEDFQTYVSQEAMDSFAWS